MSQTPVPFSRIINNTIYGAETANADGAADSFWFDLGAPIATSEPYQAPPEETFAPLTERSTLEEAAAFQDGDDFLIVSSGDGDNFF